MKNRGVGCTARWVVMGCVVFLAALSSDATSRADQVGGLRPEVSPEGLVTAHQELPDGRRLILLGVGSDDPEFPTSEDIEALGFKGDLKSGERFDPSYLITANRKGLQNVYSFELGAFDETSEPDLKRGSPHQQVTVHPTAPELEARLPAKLMNIPHARRNIWLRILSLGALTGAQFVPPIAPEAVAVMFYSNQRDKIRDKQAAFLGQAVHLQLEHGTLPELGAVLTHKELEQLGAAILIRYNMETSSWKGLFVRRDKQAKYYEETFAKRDAREEQHRKTLKDLAVKKGLHYDELGPGFGLLSIPRHEFKDWLDQNRGMKNPTAEQKQLLAIAEKYASLPGSDGDLIPYRIYALDEKVKNFDVVNMQQPLLDGTYQRINDFTNVALGVLYTYMDLWPGIVLGAGVALTEQAAEWLGSRFFEYRLAAYGRLQANLKLGAVDFYAGETGGLKAVQAVLLDHARAIGVPEKEIAHMSEALQNSTPQELGYALSYMLSQLIEVESRYATFFETHNLEKIRHVKTVHLQRLANWLREQKAELAPVPASPARYPRR